MSGFPGNAALWREYRKPLLCSAFLSNSSGFVFFALMPAIMRLRVLESTISGNPLLQTVACKPWLQMFGNRAHDRDNHGISKLLVRLRVGYGNPERFARLVEPHDSRAFARRKPTGISAGLPDQYLRTILEIPRRECPGHVLWAKETEAKAVACLAMLCGII